MFSVTQQGWGYIEMRTLLSCTYARSGQIESTYESFFVKNDEMIKSPMSLGRGRTRRRRARTKKYSNNQRYYYQQSTSRFTTNFKLLFVGALFLVLLVHDFINLKHVGCSDSLVVRTENKSLHQIQSTATTITSIKSSEFTTTNSRVDRKHKTREFVHRPISKGLTAASKKNPGQAAGRSNEQEKHLNVRWTTQAYGQQSAGKN